MNVTVSIPDEFAARFGTKAEFGRRVIEALALEEFRVGRMTRPELQGVLSLSSGAELDSFLKAHGIVEGVTPADAEGGQHDRAVATRNLVARFRAFRADKTLGGLDVGDLIREGRR